MLRRLTLFLLISISNSRLQAQSLADIEIHGFVTQGFLFSSHNNYLTMQSSSGSFQWTDGAVSFSDTLTDRLRAGIQLHMYQLGQLGGPNIQVDWASGDYRVNNHFGFRAGKVKTVMGLFNDTQDVDAVFLWALLPQCSYPVDNESFLLAHVGGDLYGYLSFGRRVGKLRYNGFVGHSSLPVDGGLLKQAADFGLVFTSAPGGKTYGGDLRWELAGLTFGSSVVVQAVDGPASGGGLHVVPFLMSAQYAAFQKGKLFLAGEYDSTPVFATLFIGDAVIPVPINSRSWYVMGSYRITKTLQVGSYFSRDVNRGPDPSLPGNYSNDWVVSGRYDFNSYFYGKVEGHFLRGTALGYYISTNPDGLKPNSNMLATRIGFSF